MSRPVEKRDVVVRAAIALFAVRGVEGTTTREIARRSGTAEGTLFRHFRDKADLAWTIYDENLRVFMARLEAGVAGAGSAKGRLRAMIDACYGLYEEDPVLCRFLLLSEHGAARTMPSGYRTPVDVLMEVIRGGQASGDIREGNPALAAALAFGAVLRVPLFKVYGRLKKDLRSLAGEVHRAVWNMLRA